MKIAHKYKLLIINSSVKCQKRLCDISPAGEHSHHMYKTLTRTVVFIVNVYPLRLSVAHAK